jgi:hypothetical protein
LKIAHNYTIILDMLEAELSDDVKAEMPGQLAMARTMAEGADNTSFCTDYRLDCVSALEKLLISIQNESDETQEV